MLHPRWYVVLRDISFSQTNIYISNEDLEAAIATERSRKKRTVYRVLHTGNVCMDRFTDSLWMPLISSGLDGDQTSGPVDVAVQELTEQLINATQQLNTVRLGSLFLKDQVIFVCVCVCVCARVRECVRACARVCICLHAFALACVYGCVYVGMCVCVHMCVSMRARAGHSSLRSIPSLRTMCICLFDHAFARVCVCRRACRSVCVHARAPMCVHGPTIGQCGVFLH